MQLHRASVDVFQENTSSWSASISVFIRLPAFFRRSLFKQPLVHVFNLDIALVVLQTPIR